MTSADQPSPIDPDEHRREQQRRRARQHRRREREGLQHLAIDVPHEVIDRLIAENYLTEAEAADRHATGKALETFLADQIE